MNSQILRIIIAGVLAGISLVGVITLAVITHPIPDALQGMSVASLAYLFGVTTNGSGFTGNTKQ